MHIYPQNEYIPYAYLIGWTSIDRWYYGIEYGFKTKIANPNNLWKTYFTSSSIVQEMRTIHGEPDIKEIRKVFSSAEEACIWENKVLRRMNVVNNNRWINMSLGNAEFQTSGMFMVTDGVKQFLIKQGENIPPGYYKGRSESYIENTKKGSKKRKCHFNKKAFENSIKIRSNGVLINNGFIQKYHPKEEEIPEGFSLGMLKSQCIKRSFRLKGHSVTEETKTKISIKSSGKKWFNNGIISIRDYECPLGFKPGRLPRSKEHNINAGNSKKGLKWYNNGVVNKQYRENNVPDGFLPGRILKLKN